MLSRKKAFAMVIAFLLHYSELSLAQTTRDNAGFASAPVPKNIINPQQISPASQMDFHPAQIWSDTNDIPINAHGGGVIFFEGIYYWYGEHKLKGKSEATFADGGIHCYYTTDNLPGTWTYHGNPCQGINSIDNIGIEYTYGGQSSYIIKVQGIDDAYIAMFDIWKPENPVTGRYIWLPVEFKNGKMSITWRDAWNMNHFIQKTKT